MTSQGVVKWYSLAKGYGFILREGDGREVFVHHSAIRGDGDDLHEGDRVRFEVVEAPKGLQAREVERLQG